MLAADRNETVWVELFLRYKADPNVPEPESGYSPLMLATYNNHLEVAYFLIKHGANLDYQVPKVCLLNGALLLSLLLMLPYCMGSIYLDWCYCTHARSG